jgi:hypothetical protein
MAYTSVLFFCIQHFPEYLRKAFFAFYNMSAQFFYLVVGEKKRGTKLICHRQQKPGQQLNSESLYKSIDYRGIFNFAYDTIWVLLDQ